jgi:hypothetical protein
MPFVPVPNTMLAEIRMLMDGQQVENTLWFEATGAPTVPSMSDLADQLILWWIANYAPQTSIALQLVEVVISDQTTAASPQVSVAAPAGTIGAVVSDALPNNVSLTVSFRTPLRGRSFRGRNFVVGIPESVATASHLSVAYVAGWQVAYAQLKSDIDAVGDFVWVVVSRFSGVDGAGDPIPRAAGVTTPVTNVVVIDDVVDSQRRRLPGRGN